MLSSGKVKRDYKYEHMEKIIEMKDQTYIDPNQDVNYMPNKKYNARQAKMF